MLKIIELEKNTSVLEKIADFIRSDNDSKSETLRPRQLLETTDNILAVGISEKEITGNKKGYVAICFYVSAKRDLLSIAANEWIPRSYKISSLKDSVITDVVHIGTEVNGLMTNFSFGGIQINSRLSTSGGMNDQVSPIFVGQDNPRTDKNSELMAGLSIGSEKDKNTGTIGAIVYKDGAPHLLSCEHILKIKGSKITQPGWKDHLDQSQVQSYVVGEVTDSDSSLDCAIAKLDARNHSTKVYGFEENISLRKAENPKIGDEVVKSGRGSKITYGRVNGIRAIVKLKGNSILENQFIIGLDFRRLPIDHELSKRGDSGSAWIKVEKGNPCNILLGINNSGDPEANIPEIGEYAFATEGLAIQNRFQFQFKKQ